MKINFYKMKAIILSYMYNFTGIFYNPDKEEPFIYAPDRYFKHENFQVDL